MRKQLKKENQHVLLLMGAKYTKYGIISSNMAKLIRGEGGNGNTPGLRQSGVTKRQDKAGINDSIIT